MQLWTFGPLFWNHLGAIAFLGIIWRWTKFRIDATSHYAPRLRIHRRLAALGYGGALGIVLFSWIMVQLKLPPWMESIKFQATGILSIGLALGLYLNYLRSDPEKRGFWHHRRIKPIGLALIFLTGALLWGIKVSAPWVSVLLALGIFHRHQLYFHKTVGELLDANEALRKKIIALDADLMQTVLQHSPPSSQAPRVQKTRPETSASMVG